MLASLEASDVAPHADLPRHSVDERPVLRIQPSGRWPSLGGRELWSYRGLLFFLVWRDVKVRYAQTVLGAGWAVLQPVLTMAVFTIIFGRFANIPSDGVPYPAFSIVALVPWTYFSAALTGASTSLVTSSNLITKVYFPRLVVPLAPVFAGLVDLAIGMGIVGGFIAGYRITPSALALLVVPVLIIAMMLTAAGVGAWLAALNVQYRDIKYVTPFLVQVWMYTSPIVYSMSQVPERYRALYALNPMVGIIEGFRSVLLRSVAVPWSAIATSMTIGLLVFLSGSFYFRRVERRFADVV